MGLINRLALAICLCVTAANVDAYGRQQQDAANNPSPALEGAATAIYKTLGDVRLPLYIFQPVGNKPGDKRAAILFFFGGGWVAGKIKQFQPQAQHFASRGMVAVVVDYRVRSRHHTTPFESIADGKSAIRWVRAHAKELGVDPLRIAAAGGSAGGHVAASSATLKEFDESEEDRRITSVPNALVLFNPVVDTTASGYGAQTLGARAEEASPLHHITRDTPPTIIFHGTADKTVPFSNATAFCAEMKKSGNVCQLVPFEGKGHGFFNVNKPDDQSQRETLQRADAFLVSLGFMQALPKNDQPQRSAEHRK